MKIFEYVTRFRSTPGGHSSWVGVLLGLVFLLFPLAQFPLIPLGDWAIYTAEMPLLLALSWIFIESARSERVLRTVREVLCAPWFLSALIFLFGVAASYLFSKQTSTGLGQIKSFYVFPVLFALVLSVEARSHTLRDKLLVFWFLGCLMAALAGVITWSMGLLTYDGRLAGPYASPNQLAMLLSPAVLIGIAALITASSLKEKIFWFLGMGIIMFSLWATHAYGAFGALFLASGCFVLLACTVKQRRFWVSMLFLGLMVWSVSEFRSEKWQSLVTLDGRSALSSRIMIWQVAGKMLHDSFPWGIGPGNFQTVYLEYQRFFTPYLEWAVPHPHNLALFFLLEGGMIGFLGFSSTLYFGWRHFRLIWVKSVSLAEKKKSVLLLALLILYMGMGLVDTPYPKSDLALAVWGVFGLLAAWSHSMETTD